RPGRGQQGRDLVDHLEAQRPLVEPPDLLHGEPELAGEPRRDAIGAEPARSAPPQQEELPERRRVLPEGGPEQDRRPTPPSRWWHVHRALAHPPPGRLSEASAKPPVEGRSVPGSRRDQQGRAAARHAMEPAGGGPTQ